MQLSYILALLAVAAGGSASPTPGAWGGNPQPPKPNPPKPAPPPPPPIVATNNCPQNSQPACCNSALELISVNCNVIVIGSNDNVENYGYCTNEQSLACCNYNTGECTGYGNEGN